MPISRELIQSHLERIVNSHFFARKANACSLLKFLVAETLNGTASRLTRADILRECFPRQDEQVVSTEKRRLRQYLGQFYGAEAIRSEIEFTVNTSSFEITFELKNPIGSGSDWLVGRSDILKALADQLQEAAAGAFHVALLEGPGGYGKTSVLRAHIASSGQLSPGVQIAFAQIAADEIGHTPYFPFDNAIESLLQINRGYRDERLVRKLRENAPGWYERLLLSIVAREPPVSGVQLAKFLSAVSERHPTIVSIEDVHLADYSTLRLIRALLRHRPARVHLILTYRGNELQGLNAQLPNTVLSGGGLKLTATPLSETDYRIYFDRRFPKNVFPRELSVVLHGITEGNPLWLSRVVDSLIAEKTVHDSRGTWRLAASVQDIAQKLPETLTQFLADLFRRLTDVERALLFAAALQGEEFESDVISEVTRFDSMDVESALNQLCGNVGLIRFVQNRTTLCDRPSVVYCFAHALYHSAVLKQFEREPTRQTRWASSTADCLIRLFPTDVSRDSIIATLLSMSGRNEEALGYFSRAVRLLLSKSAYYACSTIARQGLSAAERVVRNRETDAAVIDILQALGISILCTKGFSDPELVSIFGKGIEMATTSLMDFRVPELLYGYWIAETGRGAFRRSRQTAQRLCDLATERKDPGATIRGHIALGLTCVHTGEIALGHKELLTGIPADSIRAEIPKTAFDFQIDTQIALRCQAARAASLRALFKESRDLMEDGLRLARDLNRPQPVAYSIAMAGSVLDLTEDFEESTRVLPEATELAIEYGFLQEEAWSDIYYSHAMHMLSPNPGHLDRCRTAVEMYEASGCVVALTEMKTKLADCLSRSGLVAEGLEVVEGALGVGIGTGEEYFFPELLRLKAEFLAQSGDFTEARDVLLHALELAVNQGARLFEIKILITLAERSQTDCERVQARTDLRKLLGGLADISSGLLLRARNVGTEPIALGAHH